MCPGRSYNEAGRLLGSLIGAPEDEIRTDVPQHPEVWGGLCGWYPFTAAVTDLRARSIFGAGAEVFARRFCWIFGRHRNLIRHSGAGRRPEPGIHSHSS